MHVFGALPWRSHLALMPIIRQLPELPPELGASLSADILCSWT